MAYEAFARKYRPKTFDEVIGQEAVVRTLKNAIDMERITHAYIFSGSRGLGKTTISRILTKSLNCQRGISSSPCGECENCIEIDRGSFPDMYEIDAASNRGIDDIRALRDNVSYAPIKGRYKVYIIDEAHMLTREAFNALLKTLEEPPPNNIFILATTELHRIPDTIRSRCQTFTFKPPTVSQIKDYLIRILETEKIEYEEDALYILAEASEGGIRDSASLLDQAVTLGKGHVTVKTVEELLGFIPETEINNFLSKLKEKNIKEMILITERLESEGYDLNVFWKQINDILHKELIDISIKESGKFFSKKDIEDLIYIQNIFLKAYTEAKSFQNPKHIYQLTILKLNYIKNLVSLKEIYEKGIKVSKHTVETPKDEAKVEKKDNELDLQSVILKIGKEAGAVVTAVLKKASIKMEESQIIITVEENLKDTLSEKKDIIEKHFKKPVKIEGKTVKTAKKKSQKRDEAVDKVLELFKGKIITYTEE
ncbi:DNA polymerase III subunit gamma/tau [Persephonella sp.]